MQTVKVNKVELLTKIRANRKEHRSIFIKAVERYREEVIKRLEHMLEQARKNVRVQDHVGLIQPMDQTKEYDRAIAMIEMSVEETISLTEREFAQYVLDDWSWKDQWSNSTATYAMGSLPMPE